jgi:hypothetical protein
MSEHPTLSPPDECRRCGALPHGPSADCAGDAYRSVSAGSPEVSAAIECALDGAPASRDLEEDLEEASNAAAAELLEAAIELADAYAHPQPLEALRLLHHATLAKAVAYGRAERRCAR